MTTYEKLVEEAKVYVNTKIDKLKNNPESSKRQQNLESIYSVIISPERVATSPIRKNIFPEKRVRLNLDDHAVDIVLKFAQDKKKEVVIVAVSILLIVAFQKPSLEVRKKIIETSSCLVDHHDFRVSTKAQKIIKLLTEQENGE